MCWQSAPFITIDTDWCPDFSIEMTMRLLIEAGVKATWFITHDSPTIQKLKNYPDLFEIGIHPNFLSNSTQGSSPAEILDFCMAIAPDAVSMRTHSLVQSTPLLAEVMERTPVRVDLSLYLPGARNLEPVIYHWDHVKLLRLPYFWEDDEEMAHPSPDWNPARLIAYNGLRIFNFHPIHIYLNASDMGPYERVKQEEPRLQEVTESCAKPFVSSKPGTGDFFRRLLELMKNETLFHMGEIYQKNYSSDGNLR